MAKRELREGDLLTIKVRVTRVSDDGERATVSVSGQLVPTDVELLDIVNHEKGPNWPS